ALPISALQTLAPDSRTRPYPTASPRRQETQRSPRRPDPQPGPQVVTELPTGTVTLLFTDIAGFTPLTEELGDGYTDALGEHRRLLREAFDRHDGVEIATQGD